MLHRERKGKITYTEETLMPVIASHFDSYILMISMQLRIESKTKHSELPSNQPRSEKVITSYESEASDGLIPETPPFNHRIQ